MWWTQTRQNGSMWHFCICRMIWPSELLLLWRSLPIGGSHLTINGTCSAKSLRCTLNLLMKLLMLKSFKSWSRINPLFLSMSATLFKQLMARISYFLTDLQNQFYNHLNERIKDKLVHTTQPINTLYELIAVASDLNIQIWQREAEKNCEQGCSEAHTGRDQGCLTCCTHHFPHFLQSLHSPSH